MTKPPSTSYAVSDGHTIAYQVVGSGPVDIVTVAGWLTHLDILWENPGYRRLLDRLGTFGRVIIFDKRGVGLSDRVPPGEFPSLEQRIDDVRAVMEAAGSTSAYLFAIHESGPMCTLFAATHPELVRGIVLYGTWAAGSRTPDYPWAPSAEDQERLQQAIAERWGQGIGVSNLAPSLQGDTWFREWQGRQERSGATPAAAQALAKAMAATDVRDVLGSISVPTLVLHRLTDRMVPPEHGRYLAEHIPGATLVELPTGDHWAGVDPDQIADAIEQFVTGRQPAVESDRVLSTVLFTDIVRSTEIGAEVGDRRWRQLLDHHDAIANQLVGQHRGRLVKSTGDGLLATFDGPARGVRCAQALVDALQHRVGLVVRAGLHTGEIEVRGDDVAGLGVNLAARVASVASGGEVLVSRTIVDLVAGSGIQFADRGVHTLKGVPGEWQLSVAHADQPPT